MGVREIIDNIETKEDFIEFLKSLRVDFKDHPEEWENNTLGRYLEAASRFTMDCDRYYKNNDMKMEELSKWRIFADILYAGKIYE